VAGQGDRRSLANVERLPGSLGVIRGMLERFEPLLFEHVITKQ
jgi:hypothetical protein